MERGPGILCRAESIGHRARLDASQQPVDRALRADGVRDGLDLIPVEARRGPRARGRLLAAQRVAPRWRHPDLHGATWPRTPEWTRATEPARSGGGADARPPIRSLSSSSGLVVPTGTDSRQPNSCPSAGRCRRGCGRRTRCRRGRPAARTCAARSHGRREGGLLARVGVAPVVGGDASRGVRRVLQRVVRAVGAALLDRPDLRADRDHRVAEAVELRLRTRSRSARSSACPAPGTTSSARGSRSPSAAWRCPRPRCPTSS